MKSKLTLSVDKQIVKKAKKLANKRNSTVSQMFSDFVEENSRIEEKLKALQSVSGTIDENIAAEPDQDYFESRLNKHGW